MLKKLFLLLFVAAPFTLFAQDKIAYLNTQEIFAKMPEIKDVQEKLKAKSEAMDTSAKAIEKEYADLVEKFQKDSTEVTASVVADRQKQLEQLQERYQNFVQTSQAELEQERDKLFAPLQQKMRQAIKDVGDENNYTYIIDAAALVHVGSNAVDAGKVVKTKLGIVD
ncbi:MAG: OmpH family outer membrane protein [Dysgonomonas sp.]